MGIYFISHVGGHKYSANVMIYRRGDVGVIEGKGVNGDGDPKSTEIGRLGVGGGDGIVEGKGVVDVGAELMWCSMRVGTVSGDTFSMIVKDGRRRIVVGSEGE